MFKNYFTIAVRQLKKQKMYSIIKIGGFAMSIAACLLIALYIRDEMNYDNSYPDSNRLYRITGEYDNNGKLETGSDWPAPLMKALKDDYPEVELSGRLMYSELFYGAGNNEIRRVDKTTNNYEDKFTYADQELLDMLKIPMAYGDRAHALKEPNTMVISKRIADKYYPGENPIGKLMILNDDNKKIYKIGGVIENFPSTSHIQFNFFLTMSGYELWPGEGSSWGASNYTTYVLLKKEADPVQFQKKLKGILSKYYLPMMLKSGDKQATDLLSKAKMLIQPISDIHLKSYNIDDGLIKGDMRFIWLFGGVALFILIIACINFINLSTAKSANRAKEVGLRKVVGSLRSGLIKQFLTESMLFSFLSLALGIVMALVFLPYFNILTAKSLMIPWTSWWLFPLMIVSAFLIGFIAGMYPSFYLSSFKPIQVLKGQVSRGTKNSILRNGLVVFQFTTSIILIISTMVIYRQTHYILNTRPGFDMDQVLLIQGTNTLGDKTKNFKNELLRISDVKTVSISDYLPVSGTKRDGNTFYIAGRSKLDIGVGAQKWRVDYDYIETMGMKMVSGREFSREMPSDSSAVIINQAMSDKLNLKKPLGETIENGWEHFRVIGVMEDFNFESMRQHVDPLCIVLGNSYSKIISVKMKGADAKNAIAAINTVWKSF